MDKTTSLMKIQFAFLLGFLLCSDAFAGFGLGSGKNAIVIVIQNLCDILSGEIAISVGLLVIIYIGYLLTAGQMVFWKGTACIGGIALVIGASYIGSEYIFKGLT